MIAEVKYLTSATAVFLNLQSGLARPYWEANITVSGAATTISGTLGQAYAVNNDIVSMGMIDRERPARANDLSDIYKGDLTIALQNTRGTYSPLATASIFTDAGGSALNYMHSIINVWGGFTNLSGTAYVVQRGSFLLTKISIDSKNQLVHLTCEDALKRVLNQYVGLPGLSGTSTTWTPPSGTRTEQILTELLSGVGLTANQYVIASGYDFPYYKLQNEGVPEAISVLAQASDGYVFTDGRGRVQFKRYAPSWAGIAGGGSVLNLKDSGTTIDLKYSIDVKNLIKKVQVKFGSGTTQSRSVEDITVDRGNVLIINNETIDRPSLANALADRTLGQYKENRAFLEIDNVWLPSLEIGDSVDIYDTNTYMTGIPYQIYKIQEDIINCKSKIYAVTDLNRGQKWWFCSTSGEVNSGGVFTNSWHSGFAFASLENTGFDNDGDDDNVIDTGLSVSGAGATGIELPFLMY